MKRLSLVALAVACAGCVAGSGKGLQVGYFTNPDRPAEVSAASVACKEVDPPEGVVDTLVCSGRQIEAIELLSGNLCWSLPRAAARVRVARDLCGMEER